MTKTEKAVVRAAMRWFRMGRPLAMSEHEHLMQHWVNRTSDDASRNLAKWCARHAMVKAQAKSEGKVNHD